MLPKLKSFTFWGLGLTSKSCTYRRPTQVDQQDSSQDEKHEKTINNRDRFAIYNSPSNRHNRNQVSYGASENGRGFFYQLVENDDGYSSSNDS